MPNFKKGQRAIAILPVGKLIVWLCNERINDKLNIREWQIDDGGWIPEDVLVDTSQERNMKKSTSKIRTLDAIHVELEGREEV